MNPIRPEGFPHQRLFRLPEELRRRAEGMPVCGELTVTDTGFFPETAGHRVSRPQGSGSAILIFCVGGRGWVAAAGEELDIESGELVWIPAGLPHAYGSRAEQPWRLYWVHVAGRGVEEWEGWICRGEAGAVRWRVENPGGLAERFEALWRRVDGGGTDVSLLRMTAMAQVLLAEAVAARAADGEKARRVERRIERSVGWMRENVHRPVRLAECAAAAGMSAPHFSAEFRRVTGVSPLRYFTRLRLHRASEWLDGGDMPVQEIADRLGYANPFHFSKAFRQFTGLSPRAYRERMGGG